jgi:hypothetical protein
MSASSKLVTFCIFTDITRRDEAVIFKTINDKQKRIDTSLVDMIIVLTEPNPPYNIRWAYDLGIDQGSAFSRLVATGGRNVEPPERMVTLRTLSDCVKRMVPKHSANTNNGYLFCRNYWNVVHSLWPAEFQDSKTYKLMTLPGLKGLARYGRGIWLNLHDGGNVSESRIITAFSNDATRMDWKADGKLREASGNAGLRMVFEALTEAYGTPAP